MIEDASMHAAAIPPQQWRMCVICLGMILLIGSFLNMTADSQNQLLYGHDIRSVPSSHHSKFDPSKPSFIIHPGPSKTATTTMQHDLAALTDVLAQDKYVYLGRLRTDHSESVVEDVFTNSDCVQRLHEYQTARHQPLQNETISTHQTPDVGAVPCWDEFVHEVKEYQAKGYSIIMSSEIISNTYGLVFKQPELFDTLVQALQAVLADEWNVLVVIGYRRYAEWAVSTVKQNTAVAVPFPISVPTPGTWAHVNRRGV